MGLWHAAFWQTLLHLYNDCRPDIARCAQIVNTHLMGTILAVQIISTQLADATSTPKTCEETPQLAHAKDPPHVDSGALPKESNPTPDGTAPDPDSKQAAEDHQPSATPSHSPTDGKQDGGLEKTIGDIKTYPFYLSNKACQPNSELEVTNKYTGKVGARCALASASDIDKAIAAAEKAAPAMAKMASYQRKAVLEQVVKEVRERFEEFAQALCLEAGKPIK